MKNAYSLLKFRGEDGPLWFVVKGERHVPGTHEENQARDSYFYEEHSCPTNWLRDVVAVIEDGDTDPHGFLEFVRSVDIEAQDDEADDAMDWKTLFPETKGVHSMTQDKHADMGKT